MRRRGEGQRSEAGEQPLEAWQTFETSLGTPTHPLSKLRGLTPSLMFFIQIKRTNKPAFAPNHRKVMINCDFLMRCKFFVVATVVLPSNRKHLKRQSWEQSLNQIDFNSIQSGPSNSLVESSGVLRHTYNLTLQSYFYTHTSYTSPSPWILELTYNLLLHSKKPPPVSRKHVRSASNLTDSAQNWSWLSRNRGLKRQSG